MSISGVHFIVINKVIAIYSKLSNLNYFQDTRHLKQNTA